MIHPLGLAIQSNAAAAVSKFSLDVADKVVKIIAVIFGGIWTYLNYVRGRTFKRRLEPKIMGKLVHAPGTGEPMISGSVQVKNVGLSKVDIEKSGTAIEVSDMVPATSKTGVPKFVEADIAGGVLDVFERHRWIEPGETIEESFALPLPDREDRISVRLRLRIVSRHRILKNVEWNADSIAEVSADDAPGSNPSPKSLLSKILHRFLPEGEKQKQEVP
jgi:hypothetical protein